jgi:hypothetical protein
MEQERTREVQVRLGLSIYFNRGKEVVLVSDITLSEDGRPVITGKKLRDYQWVRMGLGDIILFRYELENGRWRYILHQVMPKGLEEQCMFQVDEKNMSPYFGRELMYHYKLLMEYKEKVMREFEQEDRRCELLKLSEFAVRFSSDRYGCDECTVSIFARGYNKNRISVMKKIAVLRGAVATNQEVKEYITKAICQAAGDCKIEKIMPMKMYAVPRSAAKRLECLALAFEGCRTAGREVDYSYILSGLDSLPDTSVEFLAESMRDAETGKRCRKAFRVSMLQ